MGLFGSKNKAVQPTNTFVAMKVIGSNSMFYSQLLVNYDTRQWAIKKGKNLSVYNFDDILGYDLEETGQSSVTKKGLGKSMVGGALFGWGGAIVGGATTKGKTTSVINGIRIRITVNNPNKPLEYIYVVSGTIKTNSFVYQQAHNQAQLFLAELALISKQASTVQQKQVQNTSTADELMKLKALLDSGVLTQEEFETEKAKILNR